MKIKIEQKQNLNLFFSYKELVTNLCDFNFHNLAVEQQENKLVQMS